MAARSGDRYPWGPQTAAFSSLLQFSDPLSLLHRCLPINSTRPASATTSHLARSHFHQYKPSSPTEPCTSDRLTMSTVTRAYLDQRLAMAKRCSRGNRVFPSPTAICCRTALHSTISLMGYARSSTSVLISDTGDPKIAEATLAGAKAAAVATVASAVPTVSHLHT